MERDSGLSLKQRFALTGAAFLAAGGLKFGSGQGSEVVHAESPTPSPTPTRTVTPSPTATPDAWATRIAGVQATGTVLAGEADKAGKLATVQAANAAIQEYLDGLRATRTPTPTPTFTKEQTEIKRQAGLLPTDTPTPRSWSTEAIPTPERTGGGDTSREIPWGWVISVPVLGGAGWVSYRLYEIWKNRFRRRSGAGTTTGAGPNVGPAPKIGGLAGGATGGPSNLDTSPSTEPAQPKNPEWVIGQRDFERRWQVVKSKLPPVRPGDTGNEQGYILDRFKAGMSIVHEVSLEDATNVPEIDTRVRAGIEYLIPEIWPDNRVFKRFFDPRFNAGFLTTEDLARTIYLPEPYRNLSSFTKAQKREINRIRRTLLHALHPDLLKSDSNPKLQDSINILLKQINSTWSLINKLLS